MKNESSTTTLKHVLLAVLLIAASALLFFLRQPAKIGQAPAVNPIAFKNQKIDTTAELRVVFDAPMDEASVAKNVTVGDKLTGTTRWEGNVMIFKPATALVMGTTQVVRVSREAQYASGRPLGDELEFKFQVAGPTVVTGVLPPKDTTEVDPNSKLTIIFDRPMVPLAIVGANQVTPENWPVTITPPVEGRWHWLGTSTMEFEPKNGLTPATSYSVSVPPGIFSVNGTATKEDYSWKFQTAIPRVLATDPQPNSDLAGPTTKISVTFNTEVSPAEAQAKAQLFKVISSKEKGKDPTRVAVPLQTITVGKAIPVEGLYGDMPVAPPEKTETLDPKTLVITPQQPLEFNSSYALLLPKGLKGVQGDLGTDADFTLEFTTVGPFVVTSAILQGSILIDFSNPVNDDTLKGNISISPKVEGWSDLSWLSNAWQQNKHIDLPANLEPSTTYTLSFSDKIKDRFDQTLKPYTTSFTTDPIAPGVYIDSKGEFGVFEASQPVTYPISTMNAGSLDIKFAKLPFPEFMKIRNIRQASYDYDPDLTRDPEYKSWHRPVKKTLNKWETIGFDVEKETGQKLSPGIYALSVQSPDYVATWNGNKPIVQYQFFTFTNTALTLKYTADDALVWAVDMQTGAPVPGAQVKFYSLEGNVLIKGMTDDKGFFDTQLDLKKFKTRDYDSNPEFWVTAEHDGDFSFVGSQWNDAFQPWDFALNGQFRGVEQPENKVDSYVYTDRPVYRPGDTVHFKGVVRLRDKYGHFLTPDASHKALVKITDAGGIEVYNKTLPLNAFGTFADDLPVDAKASLGGYNLGLTVTPEDLDQNYGGANFSVLAYRKPEYKVDVKAAADDYYDKDTLKFGVDGAYYFGAPMSNAPVTWRADSTDYFFNRYTDGWYSFALDDSWCWWNCTRSAAALTEGKGTLDGAGHMDLSFPVNLDDKALSQVVTVEATISDPNNQTVSGTASVPVHKSSVYVGVQMEDYSVAPGDDAGVKLVTVNPDGTPAKNTNVKLSLYSRVWNTVKKKSVDGQYYYDNESKDTFVSEQTVQTNEEGKVRATVKADAGGEYRVVAEVTDPKGRVSKAGASLYIYSNTYFNWPHQNNDRIDMIADKPSYSVGDTANILIKSPYQGPGVSALITVEREHVLTRKIIPITGNAEPIKIAITEDLIPNAYISAMIIKPRNGKVPDVGTDDTGAPAFKIGYVKLIVDTAHKKLNVDLKTDKKKYGPGEMVTVNLTTTDYKGTPVSAELSLGVVDMSVLALTGFELPDLVRRFYDERPLGVQTAQMLTYLIDVFKPGSKGGGGGDPEMRKRSNFKDTAYWNPTVTTDQNGRAALTFKLPDNLTTWQLLAIANTKDSLFGAVAEQVIETKKVILRQVRPRFGVVDDEMKLGAIVHNFTDAPQDFKVTLDGSGFTPMGDMKQVLTLKPDEEQKLIFPIKIDNTDKATFHFLAKAWGGEDDVTESIPVYVFGTPQAVATSGITDSSVAEKVWVPDETEAKDGTLSMTVSPSLATYLPAGLAYLTTYPYGCAEQTMSGILPNIAIKALQGFDAFKFVDDKTLDTKVTDALERLYTFQRGDGGFGYWVEDPWSYPYLTAYMLYGFDLATQAGYHVDQGVVDRAVTYLQGVLRDQGAIGANGELVLYSQDMVARMDLTQRAYILYVLGEVGHPDLSLLSNLYDKRKDLPLFSQAYLAMGLEKTKSAAGISKAKTVLNEILANARVDARGIAFEEKDERDFRYFMNTNNGTSALVLQALMRLDPTSELAPRVVRYLLAVREQGHWDTTQSTVESIMAFIDFLKATKELDGDFTATVKAGDANVLTQKFDKTNILTRKDVVTAFADMKRSGLTDVTISKDAGPGRLYYDLLLKYFRTQDKIEPLDEGLGITRTMTPVDDSQKDVKVATTFRIKLTITVPEDRHFVAVESPLPAGFEAVDLSMATSQGSLGADLVKGQTPPWVGDYWNNSWYFNHTEFRDDRIFLFADYLPTGVYEYQYLVRATTPGHFRYRPATAYEMYFPENFGQTEGEWMDIKE